MISLSGEGYGLLIMHFHDVGIVFKFECVYFGVIPT